MCNFLEDIENVLKEEKVESVVIGSFGGWEWSNSTNEKIPKKFRNKVLTWGEAKPLLDYEYDTGFGGADCHAIYVWTPTKIIFVSEYDGSTRVTSLPRNPIECNPSMPGGG